MVGLYNTEHALSKTLPGNGPPPCVLTACRTSGTASALATATGPAREVARLRMPPIIGNKSLGKDPFDQRPPVLNPRSSLHVSRMP